MRKGVISVVTYILTTWAPSFFDPRVDVFIEKGKEEQQIIRAPNDKSVLRQLQKSLAETKRSAVGKLKTQGGRLVAQCYTIIRMTKTTWDDPPRYTRISHHLVLAQDEEEAKRALPATDFDVGTGWENISLQGPEGCVHVVNGTHGGV